VRPCGLANTDPAPCRADFGDRPTLDMPEAALKERKKAVDQVDMEDKPSWCADVQQGCQQRKLLPGVSAPWQQMIRTSRQNLGDAEQRL